MRKLTTEEFIRRAQEIHGDKYDYSNVVYIGTKTKVTIICPDYGEFLKTPSNHLKGQGHPASQGKRRINTDIFIKDAIKVHGNKYDYSLAKYINNRTKVCIICPEHGEFWQTPNNHLKGQGHPKGMSLKLREWHLSNTEEFIEKARKVHGDKYEYSKVDYKDALTHVLITCKDHGDFYQKPTHHLSGHGCKDCANIKIREVNRKTQEDFINRATIIHDNFYDYSLVNYKKATEKVTILCPDHEEFSQTPNNHLRGQGCPNCTHIVSKGEQELFEYVKSLYSDAQQSNRKIIKPKELDIYIPSLKKAIEFNGTYWHSEIFKDKNHREDKTQKCLEKDVELMHIEEKDWKESKDKVKEDIVRFLAGS